MLRDDPELLRTMQQDMRAAGYVLDPYWAALTENNTRIGHSALESFRNGWFASYGIPPSRPKIGRCVPSLVRRVDRRLGLRGRLLEDDPLELSQFYGETLFRALHVQDPILAEIQDSGLGSPNDLFLVGTNRYTRAFLEFFHRLLMMRRFVEFADVRTVVEIGGSYGGQIEVLLKRYPHLACALIEIPPQLYVAQQYLSAVFPGSVRAYADMRASPTITLQPGEIVCLAPWQIAKFPDLSIDFGMNQYSFQEMSQATVRAYGQQLQRVVRQSVCLFEHPEGHPNLADPVTRDDYVGALAPAFTRTDVLSEGPHATTTDRGLARVIHNELYVFRRATG